MAETSSSLAKEESAEEHGHTDAEDTREEVPVSGEPTLDGGNSIGSKQNGRIQVEAESCGEGDEIFFQLVMVLPILMKVDYYASPVSQDALQKKPFRGTQGACIFLLHNFCCI